MRNYNLNIAGYIIRLESTGSGPDLAPSPRFMRNIVQGNEPDVVIRIHSGNFPLHENAERVFHAPFVEEMNGITVRHKSNFWSIWKHESDLYIKTIFPLCPTEKNAILRFSLASGIWDLWIDCPEKEADPLEYPLDGLILYYLTVIHSDIMIHASGINIAGKGFLFSGISGKGKSTIATLWESSGAKVIHDDRLILKKTAGGYRMYNTPVYNDDEPRDSPLHKVFIIEHGATNKLFHLKDANAVSLVMANCIQHNWGADIITGLLESVSLLCGSLPIIKLSFIPDRSIIDQILADE